MGWSFDKLRTAWPFGKRSRQTSIFAKNARTLVVRAKFDSAQTTADNRRHWANADGLSADTAASPEVRRTLRNRARYEVANNSYARGIVLTLANDVIGTGPRLQMLTDDDEVNQTIEREFAAWAKAIDLPGKLRTMRQARAQDGEAFAVLFSKDSLDSPIKLDLRLIEADQVASPAAASAKAGTPMSKSGLDKGIDGIVFDAFGNPSQYHVLKAHLGGGASAGAQDYDTIPAAGMIHWFRTDRPGQRRGLPDILPALPLFAQLRRYTLAVSRDERGRFVLEMLAGRAHPGPIVWVACDGGRPPSRAARHDGDVDGPGLAEEERRLQPLLSSRRGISATPYR